MWEQVKEQLWNLLGLFAWMWILFHLMLIHFYGGVEIYEDFHWILWLEVTLCVLIITLGIRRTIKDWR